MNYTFKENIGEHEFDAFATTHAKATFFQQSSWTHVKAEWNSYLTGVYQNEMLVAVCLVLQRKLPLNISLMYAPRGPILDFENIELLNFYLQQLKQFAKKYKTMALTIDPFVARAEYPMISAMQNELNVDYDDHMVDLFKKQDYKHTGFVLDLRDSFQPRFTPIVRLSDDKQYQKSKGYKEGLKALKRGVKVVRGGAELVDRLQALIIKTETHKKINLRDVSYFKRLVSAYKDDCLITISYIDFEESKTNTEDRLKELLKRLKTPTLTEKRREEYVRQQVILENEIKMLEEELKEHTSVDLAGLIGLKNQSKSELLYAGMNRDYQKYHGSYVNYVDAINWSAEHQLEFVSFGGNSGSFDHGIDKFKVSFDANILEYIGEFTYVNRPILNYLFNKAVAIRRK